MLRRPPREPDFIRYLDNPPPAPPEPKKTAPAASPPAKREWPIGTIAFLAVVGTGLFLRSTGLAGPGRVALERPVSRTFEVSEAPRVVVETFNGPIEVVRGEAG